MGFRSSMPETAAALDKLRFNLRALFCEVFMDWAIRIAPDGYVPSYVEACIDAYNRRGPFATINNEQQAQEKSK